MSENKTNFVDVEGILEHIEICTNLKHNIALRGKTGTGKTFLIRELARTKEKKLYTLNMTVNTTVDELKGCYVLRPSEKGVTGEWKEGTLVKAMKEGAWLCIEEGNFMREELASVLYSVMDDRKELIIDEHEGEIIKAHPDFRLFFTMNWDYRGTVRPNDAIMNRINSWFDIDYLPREQEAKLIHERTKVEKQIASNIALYASKIRPLCQKDNLPDVSTRILLNWAELCKKGLDPLKAAAITVVPVMTHDPSVKATYIDLATSIFNARKIDDDDEDDDDE